MDSASVTCSSCAARWISWKIQSKPRAGAISRSSTTNIPSPHALSKLKIDIYEVMRCPRPVVVEGKVVIELLCDLEDVGLELGQAIPSDETSQVHHFALVTALQGID